MSLNIILILSSFLLTFSVSIIEPVDGETYNGDWLPFRVIVENENEIPDSVCYSLNGSESIEVDRLNTDWPTYLQDPLHRSYSESPGPTDNTVMWTAAITGDVHEFPTPVVANGIVYHPSNLGTDSLYALNAATGEIIWKYLVGTTDDAVTVNNGKVYIASDSLWCLDAETGERIWASSEADAGGSTPALVGGFAYAGRNIPGQSGAPDTAQVSCFNAVSGSLEWTSKLAYDLRMVSCMTVWNDRIFVPTSNMWSWSTNAYLFALDITNGDVLWENGDSFEGYWDSTPVVVDGVIYIGCSDDYCRGIDAITGETIWETPMNTSIEATPSYHNGRLYLGDQSASFCCLNALDGALIWEVEGCQHNSSGIADGILYYGEYNNSQGARIIALDCETGSEIWTYTTGSNSNRSGPAIVDGVVYIGAEDWNLYAFGTGLKYTYKEDNFFADVGTNELVVTSWDGGFAVASDTVSFTVTQTGITLEPQNRFHLRASPNPIRTTASVSFAIDESAPVSLKVFDLSGREVTTLLNQSVPSGEHSLQWDASGSNGQPLSSGLYLCRIQSGEVAEMMGLCILR